MTLGAKLSMLVVALSGAFFGALGYLSVQAADHYFQDVTQSLSAPIAMYIARERSPFRDGVVDAERFNELAATAMILNPTIELYALDTTGSVVASGTTSRPLIRTNVDLKPLQRFIDGSGQQPLLGDDPRSTKERRIFSVAPVETVDGRLIGYVYAILDSGSRQQLSERAWPRYLGVITGGGATLVLLVALFVTALLYARLTLPLRSLSRDVSRFESDVLFAGQDARPIAGDEIAQLKRGFDELCSRVTTQMHDLRRSESGRREWIAHLSHDLRTPLAKLHAHLESVLRRDNQSTRMERRESMARALIHCSEIESLVADLSESARLEAPTLSLNREPFSLAELAQDAVMGLREVAMSRGVRLQCDISDTETTVVADMGLMQRLIDNLLTNAVKASLPNSTVTLRIQRHASSVQLEVGDQGIGPTPDVLSVLNEGRQPEPGAGGLGLRIISQILHLHGARAEALARPGGGTVIRVEMPTAIEEMPTPGIEMTGLVRSTRAQ